MNKFRGSHKHVFAKNLPNPTNFSNLKSESYMSIPIPIASSYSNFEGTWKNELKKSLEYNELNKTTCPKTIIKSGKFENCLQDNTHIQNLSPKIDLKKNGENIDFCNTQSLKVNSPSSKSKNNDNTLQKEESKQKFRVNLEESLYAEDKLWSILEGLQTGFDILTYCREWWAIVKNENFSSIEKIFREKNSRCIIRQSIMLKFLVIGIADYIMNVNNLFLKTIIPIKNAIYYMHQNYLIIMEFILAKLPPAALDNVYLNKVWATSLQNIIKNKKSQLQKENNISEIKKNSEQVIHILNNICRIAKAQNSFKQFIINATQHIIRQINNCSVPQTIEIVEKALAASLTFLKMNNVLPHVYEKDEVDEVLPLVDAPYLPKITEEEQKNTYTLVLDLDETLVHFFEVNINETETEGHVLVRPGAEKFIEEMGDIYELVIFTAAIQEYADKVINEIDSKNKVKYRMYRQHAIPQENNFIKDLSRIGRDLSKIIIVDNTQECFQLQPENGICIRSWFGDNNDNALDELSDLLKEIRQKKVSDVREALNIFNLKMIEQISQGVSNIKLSLD